MLGYKYSKWTLLDADQDIVCSCCNRPIPPGVMALSNYDTRSRVYICYTAACILRTSYNSGMDCIKIRDLHTDIVIRKTGAVRKYGIEYWDRNKMIPIGLEDFEKSVGVKL